MATELGIALLGAGTVGAAVARELDAHADRLAQRMEVAFRLLARFPETGHKRADVQTSEPVLFWPVGSYVVAYRPVPRPVIILRILHGARDLDALF